MPEESRYTCPHLAENVPGRTSVALPDVDRREHAKARLCSSSHVGEEEARGTYCQASDKASTGGWTRRSSVPSGAAGAVTAEAAGVAATRCGVAAVDGTNLPAVTVSAACRVETWRNGCKATGHRRRFGKYDQCRQWEGSGGQMDNRDAMQAERRGGQPDRSAIRYRSKAWVKRRRVLGVIG